MITFSHEIGAGNKVILEKKKKNNNNKSKPHSASATSVGESEGF